MTILHETSMMLLTHKYYKGLRVYFWGAVMSYLVLGIRSDAKEGDIQTPEEMVERVHAVLH